MAWDMDEFSATIKRMGEEREERFVEFLDRTRADMPGQVAMLPTKSHSELLDLLVQFTGGRSDPRETELISEFHVHIRAEIIRRMRKG
jgi:hypothetical protein